MKVKLTGNISGSRDGKPWPPAGTEIDLPDDEAIALLNNGSARAVDQRNADVETRVSGVDEETAAQVAATTTTRERQAHSKRAHEPVNLGAAAEEQPTEDDNGPRLPEVNAAESARVEDPAVQTQSEGDITGETKKPSVEEPAGKSDKPAPKPADKK